MWIRVSVDTAHMSPRDDQPNLHVYESKFTRAICSGVGIWGLVLDSSASEACCDEIKMSFLFSRQELSSML